MKKYVLQGASKLLYVLHTYPLTALGTLFFLGMLLIMGNVLYLSNRINQEMAKEYAGLYMRSLDKFRVMYSAQVVKRVASKGIQALPDYREHEGAIPFPATFSIELSEHISDMQRGIKARLYSGDPFPWRTDGWPHDAYERDALKALKQNPHQTFSRFEHVRGKWSLRASQAVPLEASCVGCHHEHPLSPRRDWKEGDVRGVQEIIIPLNVDWKTAVRSGILETSALMVTLTVMGLGILALVLNKLRRSLGLLEEINTALQRFVPNEFLNFLKRESIVDVQLRIISNTR